MDLEDGIYPSNEPYTVLKQLIKIVRMQILSSLQNTTKIRWIRLAKVAQNAKIMESIAIEVKKSGFNGITIIVSNPVDVLHMFTKR